MNFYRFTSTNPPQPWIESAVTVAEATYKTMNIMYSKWFLSPIFGLILELVDESADGGEQI